MHLKNCTEWSKPLQQDMKMSYNFVYRSVKCKKDQFKLLVEMIIGINRIFCWSQLVNFGQNFLEITSELYWVYAFMTREPQFLFGELFVVLLVVNINIFNLATIVVFLPTVFAMVLLMNSATNCFKEVCYIEITLSFI